MTKFPGIYNEKGYTAIRIWLGPKRNSDGSINPPYRRTFGPYNNANIQRAKNHVDDARKAYRRGQAPPADQENLGFNHACEIYHQHHWVQKRGRTAVAIRNTWYKLNYFKQFWGKHIWHTITPKEIELYMVWRKKQKGPNGDPISDATVDNDLNLLSSMFTVIEELVVRRDIPAYFLPTTPTGQYYNPVAFVHRDSLEANKRERVVSEEEMVKVKEYCKVHDKDMLEMIKRAILTGLRKTDLQKVNGLRDVRGVLSKSHEKKLFRMPLDFSVKIEYRNFNRRLNALRHACGMGDFHWHDWRHSAATMLKGMGFTTKQIQEFLGHSTEKQTDDYINMGKERLAPQVKGLGGHLAKVWKEDPAEVSAVEASPATVAPKTKKVCLGCKKTLPMDSFGLHSAFKDMKNSRCKKCCYLQTVERRKKISRLRAKEYAKYVDPRRSPSSAVEHSLHMGGVVGSNPSETTISEL